MRINWQNPKLGSIIAVLAVIIIAIFLGKTITGYSYKFAIALALGSLIFFVTILNTDAGLTVLIFSMLLLNIEMQENGSLFRDSLTTFSGSKRLICG